MSLLVERAKQQRVIPVFKVRHEWGRCVGVDLVVYAFILVERLSLGIQRLIVVIQFATDNVVRGPNVDPLSWPEFAVTPTYSLTSLLSSNSVQSSNA